MTPDSLKILHVANEFQDILNGVILPGGLTATATSSVSTVSSATALFQNTTFTQATTTQATAQATTQATTTTQAILAVASTTTSALTATTSVTTTTVLVEVVTFFVFALSLGGAAPGVTGSIEEFIVLARINSTAVPVSPALLSLAQTASTSSIAVKVLRRLLLRRRQRLVRLLLLLLSLLRVPLLQQPPLPSQRITPGVQRKFLGLELELEEIPVPPP
jgi:hypothetical protein